MLKTRFWCIAVFLPSSKILLQLTIITLVHVYFIYKEQHNENDHLFNDTVTILQRNTLGFTPQHIYITGQHIAKTITNVMWYLDPFMDRMSS